MNDFLWGGATASYQCEGGWQEGGRVESMWDMYLHENHLENGDVASDHYPVSYTHLDVYKRQAYQCQKPLVNRKHAVTDAHSHYSWCHIVAASAGIYFSGQIDSQMGNQILFKI